MPSYRRETVNAGAAHWAVPAGAEWDLDPEDDRPVHHIDHHYNGAFDAWAVYEHAREFNPSGLDYRWDLDDFADMVYDPDADSLGDYDDVGYDDVAPLRGPVRAHEGVFDDLADEVGLWAPGDGVAPALDTVGRRYERMLRARAVETQQARRKDLIEQTRVKVRAQMEARADAISQQRALLAAERELADLERQARWKRDEIRRGRKRERERKEREERAILDEQDRISRMNAYERKVFELWGA